MSGDLLRTKLFVPRLRPFLVPRPRLIQKLHQAVAQNCKLMLVSAPAGFGKTTLISSWIGELQSERAGLGKTAVKVAWLSLDSADSDSVRFLTYLVAAIQTIAPTFGEKVTAMLQSPQLPPMESTLTVLLNEVATIEHDFILVLDDYHVLDGPAIDGALTFLLEHMPPQMRLAMTTREDPNLPLARYRVRGQVTEIRAHDLRFTPAEASQFLNQVMGLELAADEITTLESRTEGWIAGLQIAALALQGQAAVSGREGLASFIAAFSGSHRFVMDYLVEEILQQQSEQLRTFLLQTAVLDKLSASLCNAVVSRDDTKALLHTLDRGNLFLIPLDAERKWYRYHHLFAAVLQTILREEQPEQIAGLHQRASHWYADNELYEDAIRHATTAQAFEQAADLAELSWQAMDSSFQFATWLGWVKKIPEDLIRRRPVLCTQYASALSDTGDLEASELWLQAAERLLAGAATERVIVVEPQFRLLPAKIGLIRSGNAQISGNIAEAKKYTELALQHTPEDDPFGRAQATIQLGMISWVSGDLESARQSVAAWVTSMQQVGSATFALASTFVLADILFEQGRLHEALRTYHQALDPVEEKDEEAQRIVPVQYLGLAMLYHELDERDSAAQYLQKAQELSAKNSLINWPYRWHLAQAKLKEAAGEFEVAIHLLDEAKRLSVPTPVPDIRPIAALKANLFLKHGRFEQAMAWVQAQQLTASDELSYLREFELITLARVLIVGWQNGRQECSLPAALDLLERLLAAAEAGRRLGSVLQIKMLQAIAHHVNKDNVLALDALEAALRLGEGEGYVRSFVDEGSAMQQLLRQAAERGIMPAYANKLLAAFSSDEKQSPQPPAQSLVESFSQRELDVLRLLQTELSGPEIARELVVALSTVRTHTKSIYSKLNVHNRRTAVKRAQELNLI